MEKKDKIQEMQAIEQNLHNLLLQKQAFQMEFSETISALSEIKDSKEDVYKIIGQLMIKSEKSKIEKELSDKERILKLRLDSIENQEDMLTKKAESLRKEIMKEVKK